jgi:D-tyrosyl-tRNA(Tyr) deacylase
MIALIQRVRRACVEVDGETVGAIDAGLLAFACVQPGDTPARMRKWPTASRPTGFSPTPADG